MPDIHKVGLLVVEHDKILLCRKKYGTSSLILPGGSIEAGESHEECLRRELREELGDVDVSAVEYVGTYADQAAGQNGKVVKIELYRGMLEGSPTASSEIAELVWFTASDDRALVSPSIRNKILPDLIARGVLRW